MKGLEVGQLSKQAQGNPDIDIHIEYESCKGIMGGIRYTGLDVASIMNLELDHNGRALRRKDLIQDDNDDLISEDSEDELINQLQNQEQQTTNNDNETNQAQETDGFAKTATKTKSTKTTQPPTKKAKRISESKQFYPPTHPEHTVIIEGRNPAVMAAYCEHVLGKQDITTVYLYCSPREQATRYIAREIGNDLAKELTALLPDVEYQTLAEASNDLKIILKSLQEKNYHTLPFSKKNVNISTDELTESIDDIHTCIDKFVLNESRDADDRTRYRATYDFPTELDYTSEHLYDHIIDTSNILAEDTLGAVYEFLPKNVKHLDEFYSTQTL